jgi:dTDP-4-amino-4,6-dideoxygalactose transaminase
MPVSQVGLACNLHEVMRKARKHNLKVVEDAAPSLGATIGSQRVGSISDFTVFSFDARKILTTGEGGVITTDDEAAANRLRAMRAHCATASMLARHASSNVVLERYPELGYNYKMTDIQAAIGVVQMGKLEQFIAERRRLAERYRALLGRDDRIVLPHEPAGCRHVFQSYTVRLKTLHTQLEIMSDMAAQGIATRRIVACHLEEHHRALYPALSLPHSEEATGRTLLLPMFVGLRDEEQDQVVVGLQAALARGAPKRAVA